MKRIFCDSNCAPEPSMPCTKRMGFRLNDLASAAGASTRTASSAASVATIRTMALLICPCRSQGSPLPPECDRDQEKRLPVDAGRLQRATGRRAKRRAKRMHQRARRIRAARFGYSMAVRHRGSRLTGLSAVVAVVIALWPAAAQAATSESCDFIDPAKCLFPWPNDYCTKPDATTDTGRRVNLALDAMPRNRLGKPIDPADYNRSDGFSPGQLIVTKVPGLDNPDAFRETGAVPITDIERSQDPSQPIVVINTKTLK